MAKKKPSKYSAKPAGRRAAKKETPSAPKHPSGRQRAVAPSGPAAAGRLPRAWLSGRIIPGKPPAKPLKGRNAERLLATNVRDADDRPIPRKVCDWFVRKLDASHKVSARTDDSHNAPKVAHLSPEAAQLLRESAATWERLAAAERDDARERERESLIALTTITAPKEYQDGKVTLAKPRKPISKAYCWKPDFEGEVYQAVLHYYGYLPPEHVGSITAPNGYPAKVMSPEAAALYRAHRAFWEAKHVESKTRSKAVSAARKQTAEIAVEKASASAGISRIELEAKLDRLGMLVEEDNLRLVAGMIAGFGDAWLYEALLAGSSVAPNGELKPGKMLKRFKERADLILVLALAAMPNGLSLDPSLHHDGAMIIEINADTVDIVAELASRLPNLKARWAERWDFRDTGLKELRLETAAFLAARIQGGLALSVSKIGPEEAAALAKISGELELDGLQSLPEAVAARLAAHAGDLAFPSLTSISQRAAAALEKHSGRLTLGADDEFVVDATVARHLSRHAGPISLPATKRLDAQTASMLAAQNHGVELPAIQAFPDGPGSIKLCERIAAGPWPRVVFYDLNALSPECASALATFPADLTIYAEAWSDEALVALARHQGKLEIKTPCISDAAGRALAQRGTATCLTIAERYLSPKRTLISDEAANALSSYQGQLAFMGQVEVSPEGAAMLTQRSSLVLHRSKLKPQIRKIFESVGAWQDAVWTRRGRLAKQGSGKTKRT